MKKWVLPSLFLVLVAFGGCSKVNILSIDDDKKLGQQSRDQILADPTNYPILDRNQYASSYSFLEGIKQDILNSGQVKYKTEFDWELRIIQNDTVQNAFCTPGGYIFVYTGLLKYLDNKSSLAGVLGHEMGHADHRHSSTQLTKKYGVDFLLQLLLGKNNGQLAQIGEELLFLQFSRSDETDADNQSVVYLCPTKYRAAGAADFFQKIINSGAAQPPQFLSTHPSPDNRVQNITSKASSGGCSASITTQEENADYTAFKNSLP
ncbi:MAG: M48 family metalloprotease [Chitinophagales bacterium]